MGHTVDIYTPDRLKCRPQLHTRAQLNLATIYCMDFR